jgi:hypothetical protein
MTLGRFLQKIHSDMIPSSLYLYFNIVACDTGLEGADIVIGQLPYASPIADIELRAMRGTTNAIIPDHPVM